MLIPDSIWILMLVITCYLAVKEMYEEEIKKVQSVGAEQDD